MDKTNHLENLKKLTSWSYDQIYRSKNRDEQLGSFAKQFDKTVSPFTNRLNISKKEFVKMITINQDVVSKRLSSICAYIGGKYIGNVYIDKYGNVFESITAVKEKYGKDFVLCTEQYGHMYYSDCVYIPELDAILIGTQTCYYGGTVMDIDDKNTHVEAFHVGTPYYHLITKEMNVISSNNPKSHVSNCYLGNLGPVNGLMQAVKELLGLKVGIVNVGGNKYIPLDTIHNISTFLAYKAKLAYKSGKVQNKIDELVAKKEFDSSPMTDRMPHEYNDLVCKTNINKIDDNLCVIRWSYSYMNEGFDGMRVYIEGKNVYACKRNNEGQFVKVALSVLNQKNFASEYNSEIAMDDMAGTRLEWYTSVIDQIPDKYKMTLLMMFLTDVKIEHLVKLGFCDAICAKMNVSPINIGTSIRTALRVNQEEEENRNLYKWIGINKHQLDALVDVCKKMDDNQGSLYYLVDAVSDIKHMFGCQDISHYDNATFDAIMQEYSKYLLSGNRNSWNRLNPTTVSLVIAKAEQMDESGVTKNNMIHNLPTILRICKWDHHSFNYYHDFINMVNNMNIRRQVRLYPVDYEDMKQMHDNVSAVYNKYKSQYQRNAFIARVPGWEKFEYENDDYDFCVVAPKLPEELAIEGLELHHCVKSYIERVANGTTNILFIRKKDERDKPFFTVELSTTRTIAQVHGFANRNADTEPELIDFIRRWARNKRLNIGSINSVRG